MAYITSEEMQQMRERAEAALDKLKTKEINQDDVNKMGKAFVQNVSGLNNVEAFRDIDGFFFAHSVMAMIMDPESPLRMIVINTDGKKIGADAEKASAYFAGVMVGIFLCELDKAALILREGNDTGHA